MQISGNICGLVETILIFWPHILSPIKYIWRYNGRNKSFVQLYENQQHIIGFIHLQPAATTKQIYNSSKKCLLNNLSNWPNLFKNRNGNIFKYLLNIFMIQEYCEELDRNPTIHLNIIQFVCIFWNTQILYLIRLSVIEYQNNWCKEGW